MIQSVALLKDLRAQLKMVQADLRARADDQADRWGARLQEEYAEARKRERTGYSWVVWRDNEVDQAAVAWLIAMTFVRFCEDNNLLTGARIDGATVPVGWIAGPGDRTARAEENLTAYFRENPTHNRRDWVRQAFKVLAAQPAGKALVDEAHNPVWIADISAERATALVDFWRTTDASGELIHDFTDSALDTRFLGDLYQDLSDHARKTYALLQTPVFVEEFILDQTLTPALAEFGLRGIKLIDPTCGSGHFLLGAFQRLVDQWQAEAPALDAKERVRRAMDSIHGVDLNPFAVAIARFRLTVAGLLAMGERSLVGVPDLGFHLAIGDSLLGEFGGAPQALQFEGEEETYFYDTEDLKEYTGILKPGQYHVVVGNPPYIQPKDKALNALYRQFYKTAAGKYALSVPFMELLFRLAIRGEQSQGAGYVGQITSNSFMKREFGKKLIEYLFAGHDLGNPVDLTEVIDTSGAYIPGHGTPTVILLGRRRRPVSDTVRAVLGVRGEPGEPSDPATGLVWTEIVRYLDRSGFEGKFISVTDVDRQVFATHPWSLAGGGAGDLMAALDAVKSHTLVEVVHEIGISVVIGEEEGFELRPSSSEPSMLVVNGDLVRDFSLGATPRFWPYAPNLEYDRGVEQLPGRWPFRTTLRNYVWFGKTRDQLGHGWLDYGAFARSKAITPRSIAFASVATHNHFVFDRGGKVFKQSAPVVKLPKDASDEDHLAILGLLNSSTACFWLKQVCYPKGGDPVGDKGARVSASGWDDRYDFTGTRLEQFPVPEVLPLERGRHLDLLAEKLAAVSPAAAVSGWLESGCVSDLGELFREAYSRWERLRTQLIFAQEELDWETYVIFGLLDGGWSYEGDDIELLELGQRAFEIALARRVGSGDEETAWFSRHGATPIVDPPAGWPSEYRALIHRRLDLIASDPAIRLLEQPEHKRRWAVAPWAGQLRDTMESAILDRLEAAELWRDGQGPVCRSVTELADALRGDRNLRELVDVLTGDREADLTKVLESLLASDAVPYLAPLRFKAPGLEKFRTWQQTWEMQRLEDAGEQVNIPVPPKYTTADFRKPEFWKARGKLDVPKELFILYPDLGREGDNTLVLGWAGWDYKDQALALAREFPVQDALGAGTDLLTQMVAGLVELEPWVHQWHSEMDASFGVSPAQAITGVIDQQLGRLEATRDEVTAWTPPVANRGRRPKNS